MRKLNASVVIGLIVALLGAGTVYAYGRSLNQRAQQGQQTQTVLVATSPLTAGSSVSDVRGKVRTAQVPTAYTVADPLSSLSQVPGAASGTVLVSDVPKGGQLSSASFGNPSSVGRLHPDPGHVAVAVQTDISPGVARYVDTGSLVDVFVTYRSLSGKTGMADNRTKLFVSGVKVLAVSVAQQQEQKTGGSGALGANSQQQPQQLNGVIAVLDLTPRDAERLVNATTLGTIYLGYTMEGGHRTPSGVVPDDVVAGNR